jgi:hypothetical protein
VREPKKRPRAAEPAAPPLLDGIDASLLDIVDHVLTKGIVVTGDLLLGVADIDLVYLRVSAVLCAADRILGPSQDPRARRKRHGATGPAGRSGLVARRIGGFEAPVPARAATEPAGPRRRRRARG